MSVLSLNNDALLSTLRSHLDAERYGAGTVSQYMGVVRRFLADLNKQRIAITAACPEDIERYLQGIFVRELGPVPGCYRVGRWGRIANLYTEPAHRRRGLALRLIKTILDWCTVRCTISTASLYLPQRRVGLYMNPLASRPVRR